MDEELKTEVEEILENARAAYRAGEITVEDMRMIELIYIQAETELEVLDEQKGIA